MQTLFGPFRPREMATKIGNVSKVASVDDTPSVDFGRTTFANCGSHPRHSDDSRHCVPAEGPRGLCLEPTSNGSTEYCALRATTMRKACYLMPQVKCSTSETCNGVAMATAACCNCLPFGNSQIFVFGKCQGGKSQEICRAAWLAHFR